jgi:hypothetical protein
METVGASPKIFGELLSRSLLILIMALLLVPTVFVIYSTHFPEVIRVGVILAHDDLEEAGEIAKNGLNDFHGIFSASMLDTRFNEDEVRVQHGSYLTDDYLNKKFADGIRSDYDVDIVLIITDKLINNWLGNGLARWGQADTESGVALLTISPVYMNTNQTEDYIISVSRHEILHILGYHHPNDDRRCLMEYASLEKELCGEYEMVLPYHVALWRLGSGQEPARATFLIRATLLLFISPLFILAILMAQILFKRFIYRKAQIHQNPLVYGIGALYITLILAAAFIAPIYPQFAILNAVVFLYIILEVRYHE